MKRERDEAMYRRDIVDCAEAIATSLRHVSRAKFDANPEKKGFIVYQLILIGEAASKLSSKFRKEHPAIPWNRIIGMRNIATHQYWEVDYDIVWKAVHDRVPELARYLRALGR